MKKFVTLEDLAKAAGFLAGHFGKAASHHDGLLKAHDGLHKVHGEQAAFYKGLHDSLADDSPMKATYAKAYELHTAKAAHHESVATLHKAHSANMLALGKEFSDDATATTPETGKAAGAPAPAPAVGTPANPTAGATVNQPEYEFKLVKSEDGKELYEKVEKKAAAASGEQPSGSGIDSMIRETTSGLVKKSLEMLNSDTTVQDEIRKMVLEGVRSALGNKMIPTDVRGVLPDIPVGSNDSGRTSNDLTLVPRTGSAATSEHKVEPELAQLIGA